MTDGEILAEVSRLLKTRARRMPARVCLMNGERCHARLCMVSGLCSLGHLQPTEPAEVGP